MREIKMSDKVYDFIAKLLEQDEVQNIGRNAWFHSEEEELTQAYELFHKKKKVKR